MMIISTKFVVRQSSLLPPQIIISLSQTLAQKQLRSPAPLHESVRTILQANFLQDYCRKVTSLLIRYCIYVNWHRRGRQARKAVVPKLFSLQFLGYFAAGETKSAKIYNAMKFITYVRANIAMNPLTAHRQRHNLWKKIRT